MADSLTNRKSGNKLLLPVLILAVIFILSTLATALADNQKETTDKDGAYKVRIENNKLFFTTPNGEEQSVDLAPTEKTIPYYRIFRDNLNIGLLKSWPPDVIRRLIFECKFEVEEYAAEPNNRKMKDNLTNKLGTIIQETTGNTFFQSHYYENPKWYQEAIDTCKQAIRIKSDDADMHCLLGLLYTQLKRYQEAIDAFKQAIRIKSDDAEFCFFLGFTYNVSGRSKEAVEQFKRAIQIKPDYMEAHFFLGITYVELNDNDSALREYGIIEKLDKEQAREMYDVFHTLKPNLFPLSIAALSLSAQEKNSAETFMKLGMAYYELKRYQEAVDAYKQAIRLKPDYSNAYGSLGLTYLRLSRYQEAVDAYKQAIRLKPDFTKAYFSLGAAYVLLGDKSSALDQYNILKDLDSDLANKLFNLINK